jgi:hypothetical protein
MSIGAPHSRNHQNSLRVPNGIIFHCQSKTFQRGANSMGAVFIEPRPKSWPQGSHIDDYVVEDHADHVLQTFKSQREAIEWAKSEGHHPLVARVRHLNDKKVPDHWRAA